MIRAYIFFYYILEDFMFKSKPIASYQRSTLTYLLPTQRGDTLPVSRIALLQLLHHLQQEQQRSPHACLHEAIVMIQHMLANTCHPTA